MFDKIVETICHSLCASVQIEMQKISAWQAKQKKGEIRTDHNLRMKQIKILLYVFLYRSGLQPSLVVMCACFLVSL